MTIQDNSRQFKTRIGAHRDYFIELMAILLVIILINLGVIMAFGSINMKNNSKHPFFKRKHRVFQSNEKQTSVEAERITSDLYENVATFKRLFSYPENEGLIIREVFIQSLHCEGFLLNMEGMANHETIESKIVTPLLQTDFSLNEGEPVVDQIKKKIPIIHADVVKEIPFITKSIVNGFTCLFIEGYDQAIVFATTEYEHRSVEKPVLESVLRGPQEAFIESGVINRSLIRKRVRNASLISESMSIGKSGNEVTLMYIKDIVEEELVERVKERIDQIEVDLLQGVEELEQHIEERPYSVVPTVLYTERPDRAAGFLQEGHVLLLMDNSSACLIVPVTFFSLFQTSEDTFERWAYGNFIRFLRISAIMLALLTPSIYVALVNYHASMLQTDLLLAVAATREKIPFPTVVEVLIMELSFELIREAGIRIPTPIGATIGIVGALIIGQAAVDANLISPVLVIVIAITGLAAFAIPNNSLGYMIRMSRFGFTLFALAFGFYGITGLLIMYITYLVSIKSFGVYFFSPIVPKYNSSRDLLMRPPIWKQWIRPGHVQETNPSRKTFKEGE